MKGTAWSMPAPRRTDTRARPSRVGRITSRSPVAEISISSARSATNSESIATGDPRLGASVEGFNDTTELWGDCEALELGKPLDWSWIKEVGGGATTYFAGMLFS